MPPPISLAEAAALDTSPVFTSRQPPSTSQPVNNWSAASRHPFRWPPRLTCSHRAGSLLQAQRLFFPHANNDLRCQKLPRGGVVCSVGQQQPPPAPQPQLASPDANAPAFPTIPAHVHTITSPANAYIRHCVQVRQSRSYRDAANSVLVVGGTPLREICEAASQQRPRPNCPPIQVLFLLESWTPPPSVQAGRVVRVNEAVMRKLAGVETAHRIDAVGLLTKPATFVSFLDVQSDESEGRSADQNGSGGEASGSGRREEERTAGLCSQPSCYMSPQEWCPTATHVVALDGIQDPGNLGTLLRTALAFNWDGVFLLPGCCDPFNDKALRSSRGAVFRLNLAAGDWTHFESVCAARKLACYGGDPEYATYPPVSFEQSNGLQKALQEPKLSLVLGNESNGLSGQARIVCQPVAIPMAGDMESLNVAVAGGILMYLLRPEAL